MKNHTDAPTRCKVLTDFEVRGVLYRAGTTTVLRRLTADLLEKAGKVRILGEPSDAVHFRTIAGDGETA
jgi:ABC-type hemin transport system ATPase subunit